MKLLRQIVIGIAGGAVLLVGIAMIVLPGPAILVIPAGLAILAIEFVWAKRILRRMRRFIAERRRQMGLDKLGRGKKLQDDSTLSGLAGKRDNPG